MMGGSIQSLAVDPHSSRLVVTFAAPRTAGNRQRPATSASLDSEDEDADDLHSAPHADPASLPPYTAALVFRMRTEPMLQLTPRRVCRPFYLSCI